MIILTIMNYIHNTSHLQKIEYINVYLILLYNINNMFSLNLRTRIVNLISKNNKTLSISKSDFYNKINIQ